MLPVTQATKDLAGVSTEVVIQNFADRILVLVTQLGKVGNLIQATIPLTEPLLPAPTAAGQFDQPSLPTPPPSIQLTSVLGNAQSEHLQTLHSFYASQIATLIWTAEAGSGLRDDRRPIVVGIALRKSSDEGVGENLTKHERTVFLGVMEIVKEFLARK